MKGSLLICVLVVLCGVSCRRADIRTVQIHVEGLTGQEEVRKLANAMMSTRLIKPGDIKIDTSAQTVTVTYDSMKLAIKNIEHSLAEAGFSTYTVRDDGSLRQGVPAAAKPPPASPEKSVAPKAPVGPRAAPAPAKK